MSESRKTVQVVVKGRVQGVGFRYALRDVADRNQVTGWCRNRPDGAVEAVLSGVSGAVDAVVGWCGQGPSMARVDHVGVTRLADESSHSFEIRH